MTGATERATKTAPARRIWAVVPFRGPVGSKRRLSGLLSAAEREQLSLAMLGGVLDVLLVSPEIERVLLLTPSPTSAIWPVHERLSVVEEPRIDGQSGENDGLNAALRHAQDLAAASGATGLTIVPSDLPTIAGADLAAILDAAVDAPVAIAPDSAAEGTNALLLQPPHALVPSFGVGSFARHRHLAEAAGLRVAVVERSGLALDLDTPDDVDLLLASGQDGAVSALLRQFVGRIVLAPQPPIPRMTS